MLIILPRRNTEQYKRMVNSIHLCRNIIIAHLSFVIGCVDAFESEAVVNRKVVSIEEMPAKMYDYNRK